MKSALLLVTALGVAGCASIGPGTVTRDRFDYTGAVAESWKSQMLLNLAKLRYGAPPVFLDVGQIVSGYTMQSTFSAGGSVFSTSGVVPGVPSSSVTLGAQGQYVDRPTIPMPRGPLYTALYRGRVDEYAGRTMRREETC